jgi:hypothetical protein
MVFVYQRFLVLFKLRLLGLWVFCVLSASLSAQNDIQKPENMLIETYWQYGYTLHLESGTVVHQSDPSYPLVVIFHYDSVYRLYNNGLQIEGKWHIANGQMHFPFRQLDKYRLTSANAHSMELAFNPPNNKGTFIYHFVATTVPLGMFSKRDGELAEVVILEKLKRNKAVKASKKSKKQKAKEEALALKTPIQIEITGGGYYGGIDPVLRDHIVIKSNGRLVQEIMTKERGLIVHKKDIPRDELEAFVVWAEQQSFFDFERQYDCKSNLCDKRKLKTPKPTPLRICITYGNRRKMVTVAIWGKDKTGDKYVDYPPQIDNIVEAVQRMANRI